MHIDRQEFNLKCREVIDDINNQKISTPVWGWIAFGAMSGFILSCLKIKRKEIKPILAGYRNIKGEMKNG